MFDAKQLLGSLMEGGMTRSTGDRIGNALNGLRGGQSGDLLGQLFGRTGAAENASSGGGFLGNLANAAKGMMGGASESVKDGNPLAVGGLGALAGALLGGGGDAAKGALGGGALALLGTLAMQALGGEKSAGATGASGLAGLGLQAPSNETEEAEQQESALLMLKAMVNAAKADGQIDPQEMHGILGKLEQAGADAEAREFVRNEMLGPLDTDTIVRQVGSPELAVEVYGASLLAIEVDTEAERDYLSGLARRLGLTPEVIARIHTTLGVA